MKTSHGKCQILCPLTSLHCIDTWTSSDRTQTPQVVLHLPNYLGPSPIMGITIVKLPTLDRKLLPGAPEAHKTFLRTLTGNARY